MYILNNKIGYIQYIYSYTVSINLMFICTELSNM